jgi:anti-anti-sigma regulatory factor
MSARVIAVSEPNLSSALVAKLAAELRAAGGAAPAVLDLRTVQTVEPAAVAALIELGRSQNGIREVCLSGLSRALTLTAVQAGLAERFTVQVAAPSAKALIYELPGAIGAGALDVAGEPLIVRQLQWLRDHGIEDVVVEVTTGNAAAQRAALLLGDDPLSHRCTVVPTRSALGALGLAERVGLDERALFLALPADTLVNGPIALGEQPTILRYPAPPFAPQASTRTLQWRSRERAASEEETELEASSSAREPNQQGWALALHDLGAAHALSCAVLRGQVTDILVHAAETRPGIWLARGARVAEEAKLEPPVLIGRNARVFGDARLGPNVIVGADAVIERGAELLEASVRADTLVGEGARVRNAQVDARGIVSFAEQARTEVDDPLQLTNAVDRSAPLSVRVLALLALGLLGLPWLLAFSLTAARGKRVVRTIPWRGRRLHVGAIGVGLLDLVPALYDVLRGQRDLLGVASARALEVEGVRLEGPARAGALDVSQALAPSASTSTLLWMWRWYLLNKSFGLDRQLLGPALLSALRSQKNDEQKR